jgi:hypothetical protein
MNRLIDPASAPDDLLGEMLGVLWRGLADRDSVKAPKRTR